ncbi:MAG: hypothetical protein H0V50_06505 [Thermoleophilaceae bacterium]|nr:hypothetical protein [Thermoleophilaceae bacterium]
MTAIREAIYAALAADHPMTVRGAFYRVTVTGAIAKTEAEYQTVKRLLADMRRSREVPYNWIADSSRWMRRPTTYSSAEEALRRTAATYRQALWDDAPVAVEVWLEKEALAGVLAEVCREWDVPLMVCRGYPSMSFLHSAAEAIHGRAQHDQHTHLYYFGDHDPSGVDIDRAVRQGIGESLAALDGFAAEDAGEAEDTFYDFATLDRVAVTTAQIGAWNLPTRPTKASDSRARNFKGASVEVDSIQPAQLRQLAESCIEAHVDRHELGVLQTVEAEERRVLERMAATLDGGDQ